LRHGADPRAPAFGLGLDKLVASWLASSAMF
jgi:hypothetical protein